MTVVFFSKLTHQDKVRILLNGACGCIIGKLLFSSIVHGDYVVLNVVVHASCTGVHLLYIYMYTYSRALHYCTNILRFYERLYQKVVSIYCLIGQFFCIERNPFSNSGCWETYFSIFGFWASGLVVTENSMVPYL